MIDQVHVCVEALLRKNIFPRSQLVRHMETTRVERKVATLGEGLDNLGTDFKLIKDGGVLGTERLRGFRVGRGAGKQVDDVDGLLRMGQVNDRSQEQSK